MYNSQIVPSKTEIEKAFKSPLGILLQLSALIQSPDTDSDVNAQIRLANGEVADQLALLLRQFDRMGFVDIIDDEHYERVSSELVESGRKSKLIISISGSRDEVVEP
jgi:hypothetical protein